MTETPDSPTPEPEDAGDPIELGAGADLPKKEPAEEAQAEPYDAAASNEPTIDAQATEEEDPEHAVPGDHPWAVACHLGLFVNLCCMLGILVPLIIREKARKLDPEVDFHAKEALNFQLNVIPLFIILLFLALSSGGCPLLLPAIIGLPTLVIASTGYAIIAAMKASEGKRYRYPFIKRLID